MVSIFLHELEENSVVHSTEGTFEVRVGCVYAPLGDFCIFIHHDMCSEAVVYVSVGAESICSVTEDAFGFRCLGPNASEDGYP